MTSFPAKPRIAACTEKQNQSEATGESPGKPHPQRLRSTFKHCGRAAAYLKTKKHLQHCRRGAAYLNMALDRIQGYRAVGKCLE